MFQLNLNPMVVEQGGIFFTDITNLGRIESSHFIVRRWFQRPFIDKVVPVDNGGDDHQKAHQKTVEPVSAWKQHLQLSLLTIRFLRLPVFPIHLSYSFLLNDMLVSSIITTAYRLSKVSIPLSGQIHDLRFDHFRHLLGRLLILHS